jgi:hypothetical protein
MSGNYGAVNAVWARAGRGEAIDDPLDPREAVAAARKLFRIERGYRFIGRVAVVRGKNRRTRMFARLLTIAPDAGWRALVHDLSHDFHRVLYPHAKPHASTHTVLERRMAEHVVSSGWLEGKLRPKPKPEKPKPAVQEVRHARTVAAIGRWEAKERRARNALKKLRARARYYERAAAKRGPVS